MACAWLSCIGTLTIVLNGEISCGICCHLPPTRWSQSPLHLEPLGEPRHVSWDCHMGTLACYWEALSTPNMLCSGASQKTELFKKLLKLKQVAPWLQPGIFWVGHRFWKSLPWWPYKSTWICCGIPCFYELWAVHGRSVWCLRWKLNGNLHLSPRRDFHIACGRRASACRKEKHTMEVVSTPGSCDSHKNPNKLLRTHSIA